MGATWIGSAGEGDGKCESCLFIILKFIKFFILLELISFTKSEITGGGGGGGIFIGGKIEIIHLIIYYCYSCVLYMAPFRSSASELHSVVLDIVFSYVFLGSATGSTVAQKGGIGGNQCASGTRFGGGAGQGYFISHPLRSLIKLNSDLFFT